jgi:integrase
MAGGRKCGGMEGKSRPYLAAPTIHIARAYAAPPYSEVPPLQWALRQQEGMAALALEFLILTACRSGEVRGARWSEIDMANKVWTIVPMRMKAGREHRVPLSNAAMAILEKLAEARASEFVFFGRRLANPISPMAMMEVLRRMNAGKITVHGFRSAFRDWAGNETSFPREVCEAALAHSTGNAVEAAYRREDALEKRRTLMDSWAAFIEPNDSSNVIRIRAAQ